MGVQVVRQELDFSKIAFSGANVPVDIDAQPSHVTVQNAPPEAEIPEIQYWKAGDEGSKSEEPPSRNSEWIGWVSATYTYDAAIYYVDKDTVFENGTDEAPYYMDVNESGANSTVTITHRYQVVPGTWDNISCEPINPTYSGQILKGVHLSGIARGTIIEWSYTDPNGTSGNDTATMDNDSANIDVVDVINAGEYTVQITLTNQEYKPDTYELPEITVTVHKKPLPVPTVSEDLEQYTGKEQTGVADPAEEEKYTISGNKGTDAKDYTATATLKPEYTANYCWEGEPETEDHVDIPWSIARRYVMVPNLISSASRESRYNGQYQELITEPDETIFVYEAESDESTTMVGKFPDSDVVAFKVENGRVKDASEQSYQITATLESDNYQWVGAGAPPDDTQLTVPLGSWRITPIYLTAPTLSLSGRPYNGQPYQADPVSDEALQSIRGSLAPGDSFTFAHYTYDGSDQAPTNAKTYQVRAVYNYNETNYVLQGNNPVSVRISPVALTLTAPYGDEPKELKYTGADQKTDPVKVSDEDLVNGEQPGDVYKITYSWYEESKPETISTQEGTPPALKDMGTYTITATLSAVNYEAAPVTYTVIIGQGTQGITLTPVAQRGGAPKIRP